MEGLRGRKLVCGTREFNELTCESSCHRPAQADTCDPVNRGPSQVRVQLPGDFWFLMLILHVFLTVSPDLCSIKVSS